MLPTFRKNEGVITRRPPPKRTPSSPTGKPREKPLHFFTKQLTVNHTSKKRRDKYDKEPLLLQNKTEDRMRLTESLQAYKKKVMGDVPVQQEQLAKPQRTRSSFVPSPFPHMRSSDHSHVTATTASASSGSSSGSCHSGMTISPPLSPVSRRTPSPTDFALVPYDEGVEDIDVDQFCSEILSQYELEDEASTTVLVSYNHNRGIQVVPEQYPPIPEEEPLYSLQENTPDEKSDSPDASNPADYILKLVEDCEARWTSYTQSLREMSLVPALSRALSGDSSSSPGERPPSDPTQSVIVRQQKEIEYLRTQLLRQRDFLIQEEEACDRLYPAPLEQIDTIPVDQIEVDEEDNVSVTSAMTDMQEVPKLADDSMSLFAAIPPTRPDAASVVGDDFVLQTKRVQNMPLKLQAANGRMRRALYTGPCKGGVCTGVGSLRFETGDTYTGEVVNGKMHGRGTYTFAKRRVGSKILRGMFENNVYIGWNTENDEGGTTASF